MRDYPEDEDLDVPVAAARGGTLRWALIWVGACFVAVALVPFLFRTGASPRLATAPAQNQGRPAQTVARSIYAADGSGHFFLEATVNGTAIRFLVDTGASFVTLTSDDARAIGVNRNTLTFNQRLMTAKGPITAAEVTLREVRLGQIEQTDVPAMVVDSSLPISLLGMSFLKLLDGYDVRDGKLSLF